MWPMIELEADDALASAAHLASADERVQKVCIWTPDKDLAQCVRGDRVVQVDRKSKADSRRCGRAREVRRRADTDSRLPRTRWRYGRRLSGHRGHRRATAARLVKRHGAIEHFPPEVLGEQRELALLFKTLATLRTDAALFDDVEALRWRGPIEGFASRAERFADARLLPRVLKAAVA